MKFRTFLLCALAAFGIASAATYTKQNARVHQIHGEVKYTAGTPSSVVIESVMVTRLINDADASDILEPEKVSVTFDLLNPALANTNITAATRTVTYPQLAALLRQACLDRATAQGVTLNWQDNSNNESGFEIERSDRGGAFRRVASVGRNVTTYRDPQGLPDSAYRVRAINAAGASAYTTQ